MHTEIAARLSSLTVTFLRAQSFCLAAATLIATHSLSAQLRQPQRSGAEIYLRSCATCHDAGTPRTPTRTALQAMSAARILRALDVGVMTSIASPLRRVDRQAVSTYLGTTSRDASAPPASAYCQANTRAPARGAASWKGWGPVATNARYQPADAAELTSVDLKRMELKWAFGFDGDVTAFGAPTVFEGTLVTGSASGSVYALDARSGCVHWVFQADGPVRSAPVPAADAASTLLFFGDQIGWFYAIDAASGQLRWKKRVEAHEGTRLTGSPAVHNGVVFVPAASWEETRALDPTYPCCTFRGSVTALRMHDGGVVWKTYMVGRPKRTGGTASGVATFGPSGAGIWSTPTIDTARGALYVTTGDNYSAPASATSDAVVALALNDGHVRWTQQTTRGDVFTVACAQRPACGPDYDFGASAMLLRAADGRDMLVAGQKSGVVYALDPDRKGRILWSARVGNGGTFGGVQWGMAADGRHVYAAVSDVVRLPVAAGTGRVGAATFDPVQGGGLTALRISDGTKAWFAPGRHCEPPRPGCSPAQSGAVSAIPGAVFSGSIDGHLRAFSSDDGALLWDVDTVRDYATLNGVAGKGGSLDGAGAVIVGGMVYVNSGYPRFGGMPGNVLLAFGPKVEPRK